MAPHGMVTVTRGGTVTLKVVSGCFGYRASAIAEWIKKRRCDDPERVLAVCREFGFGCPECRVIQYGKDSFLTAAGKLPPWYSDHFHEPGFNPRLKSGLAENYEHVELPKKAG